MLKDWMPRPAGEQNEQKARLKRSREELAALQMKLKENKLPVLVLVEGWGAAGKGSLIRSLIKDLDPRFFQVVNMGRPTSEEQRYPFLKRYVQTIPEEGKIVFLDSGWMDEVVRQRQQKTIDSGEYELRLQSTEVFERQLVANGYLLVKLFLHIDRATPIPLFMVLVLPMVLCLLLLNPVLRERQKFSFLLTLASLIR